MADRVDQGASFREQMAHLMRRDEERANVEPDDSWARVRLEAEKLAPGDLGTLLWLDARCQMAGMHGLDTWWVDRFGEFYDSGKPVMVCRKGLRAGGSASACRSLVRDLLFTIRLLDSGTIGVAPIMSSSRDEATDRFFTIKKILRACGMAPVKKKGADADGIDEEMYEVLPGGVGGEYRSAKSLAGGGVIQLQDSQGHKLELRILPAIRRAAVGYTGVGGFLDESDLWPNDPEMHVNPAGIVISDVMKRFTTQPSARLYIFSASYYAKSAHSERVDMGDTSAQYLARLGAAGARKDTAARRGLAERIGSDDPRLLAEADPSSPDIPAWVTNATQSPIERCYQLCDDKIGTMLALYGGRAAENADATAHPDNLAKAKIGVAPAPERQQLDDIVIALRPSLDGSDWAILVVGVAYSGGGRRGFVLEDASGRLTGGAAAAAVCELAARHLVVAAVSVAPLSARAQADLDAHVAGRAVFAPPVADVVVRDGKELRVGVLRTLYDEGRLVHVAGLGALEAEERGWGPKNDKPSPRVEALIAAVHHLQLGAWAVGGEPWQEISSPALVDALHVGRSADTMSLVRRLGARVE